MTALSKMMRRGAAGATAPAGPTFDPENDITWHSLFWAEGTDFLTQGYSDTDPVGTWPNETGETDATQGTGANQPTYSATGGPNSKPCVTGDSTDYLATGSFSVAPSYTSGVSFVAVGGTAATSSQNIFGGSGATNRNLMGKSSTNWRVFSGTTPITGGTSDTNDHLFVGWFDGSSGNEKLWVDGSLVVDGNAGVQTIGGITLMADYAGGNNWAGDLSFVGVYEGDFTQDASYPDFISWASSHYGLTIAGADFDPEADITWHSLFWAEGTNMTAEGYSDTDAVDAWPNETAEQDLAQASASLQPTFDAVHPGFNDRPVVDSDASEYMQTAAFDTAPDYTSRVSFVAVAKYDSIAGYIWASITGDTRNDTYGSASSYKFYTAAAELSVTGANTNPHLFIGVYPGSAGGGIDGYIDGVDGGNTGTTSAELTGLSIFARYDGTTSKMNGQIAFIGIYEGDITTDGAYDDLKAWVHYHYGIAQS